MRKRPPDPSPDELLAGQLFPHVAWGGGWSTEIVITSDAERLPPSKIEFLSTTGDFLDPSEVMRGLESSVRAMDSLTVACVQTSPDGPARTGVARYDGAGTAAMVLRNDHWGSDDFRPAPVASGFRLQVTPDTRVSIFNTRTVTDSVSCDLRNDSDMLLKSGNVSLCGWCHVSFPIGQSYGDEARGTLRCEASGDVAASAVKLDLSGLSLSAVAVTALPLEGEIP